MIMKKLEKFYSGFFANTPNCNFAIRAMKRENGLVVSPLSYFHAKWNIEAKAVYDILGFWAVPYNGSDDITESDSVIYGADHVWFLLEYDTDNVIYENDIEMKTYSANIIFHDSDRQRFFEKVPEKIRWFREEKKRLYEEGLLYPELI